MVIAVPQSDPVLTVRAFVPVRVRAGRAWRADPSPSLTVILIVRPSQST
jgi:hypothetical protein